MIGTDEQVARSIATAAVLILNGKDPDTQFSDYGTLPVENGRAIAVFRGQNLPVTFGPTGSFLVPSVMLEYGPAPNEKGVVDRPVVLSISRKAEENSIERELMNIGDHSALLRDFVFKTGSWQSRSCPVYEFQVDSALPIGIVGSVAWAHPALRSLPKPIDRTELGADFGGWIRKSFHFTCHYCLTSA